MTRRLEFGLGLAAVLIAACFVPEVNARPQLTEDQQLEGQQQLFPVSIVAAVVGLVGVTVIVLMCAEKKVNPNVNRTGPPEWTRSLEFKQEINVGFGDTSEGIHAPTPFHIVRERVSTAFTDAARWSFPFTQGKHVFEVYWPIKKNRGTCCCIGVGTDKLKLVTPGRTSLVGDHSESWSLDLAKHASIHFGKMQQRLSLGIPERFFVYLDMDSGKIGFGDNVERDRHETEFYGYICHGIPKGKTYYFMISLCARNEHVHVHYRGTATPAGGFNLLDVPSPLQFSTDNSGNVHLVPPSAAPPAYMAAAPQQQQQMADAPPPPVYPALEKTE